MRRTMVTGMVTTTATTIALAAVLGLAATAPGTASAAAAEAEGATPRVLTPADGASLTAPVDAVTVDFSGAEPGAWELRFSAADGTLCGKQGCPWDTRVEVGASEGERTVELRSAIRVAGDYDLQVTRAEPNDTLPDDATSGFSLDSAVRYSEVRQRDRTFTPRRRDGVDDRTFLSFDTVAAAARPTVSVLDATGALVRTGTVRDSGASDSPAPGPGPVAWFYSWDGRDDEGATVPAGSYRVLVSTADEAGVLRRVRRGVVVEAAAARAGVSREPGDDASILAASRRCSSTVSYARSRLTLRCRAGEPGYALAAYDVRVPERARVLGFFVRAETTRTGPDGRVTRRVERISPRTARVRIRLTGGISTAIDRVAVRWEVPAGS